MRQDEKRMPPPPAWWEEVSGVKAEQADLKARVSGLEEYEARQNGSLQRMDRAIESIRKDVADRLGKIQWWLIGLLGSAVVSLILLVVNLVHEKI